MVNELTCPKCEAVIRIKEKEFTDLFTKNVITHKGEYHKCPSCHCGVLMMTNRDVKKKPTHQLFIPEKGWENSVQRRAIEKGQWLPIREIA